MLYDRAGPSVSQTASGRQQNAIKSAYRVDPRPTRADRPRYGRLPGRRTKSAGVGGNASGATAQTPAKVSNPSDPFPDGRMTGPTPACLGKRLFLEVNRHLADCGITISGGTIVDATIIGAPSSTKIGTGSAIRRCIEPRRVTSGTSGLRPALALMAGRSLFTRLWRQQRTSTTMCFCPPRYSVYSGNSMEFQSSWSE